MLNQTFIELIQKYSPNTSLARKLWNEIEMHYSKKNRFYHNLCHLENLYNQLLAVKDEITDWDTVLFSLYYHDIIYNPAKNDNENNSAEFARQRLQSIAFTTDKISKCVSQILATKEHSISDEDTNLFTDADLSILGQTWETYEDYFGKIRKEYSMYPDFIYKNGRKKVLNHFIAMDRIFKTKWFYDKYESLARQNLAAELALLN